MTVLREGETVQFRKAGLSIDEINYIRGLSSDEFKTGSLSDPFARYEALARMQEGGVVAGANLGVGYMLIDGWNSEALDSISVIKGDERQNMAMGSCLPAEVFTRYVDYDNIHPELVPIFRDAKLLERIFGCGPFIRIPANPKVDSSEKGTILPGILISSDANLLIQNWIPKGNGPFSLLIDGMLSNGMIPAITSANKHGQPEIVVQTEAANFASTNGADYFLYQPSYPDDPRKNNLPHGSYPILFVDKAGAHLVRSGRMQNEVIMRLLPRDLINLVESGREPNYEINTLPQELLKFLSDKEPQITRLATLMFTFGKPIEAIISKLTPKAANGQ